MLLSYLERKQKVLEGINLILSLFSSVKQQRMFPRTIMTGSARYQVVVNSVEEMIKKFEEANFEDCRINAYHAFLNEAEQKDYENGINLDLFAPNILFIDLDQKDFLSKQDIDKIVKRIFKHVSIILHRCTPLLIWSGRGYHIIIPVQQTEALEHFDHFDGLTNRPSEELLQFAKQFLSLNKADKANNPAFKSCLLRVPYTLNSKCFDEDKDPEVKIIQKFDFSKPLPKVDNLLIEFMTFLSDRKIKECMKTQSRTKPRNKFSNNKSDKTNSVMYIENLLTIPIDDYRKNAVNLILAPYFVNVLKLSDLESFNRIKQWTLKCNALEPLRPSTYDFDNIIKYAVKRSKETSVKPLKFKDSLQHKNKELFRLLAS